ncbi:MAG: hypothetical protein GX222_02770 [Ruminococcaceae bacterium]|nr:hypothetical protein [Oscillospiraceae bacterium]
MKITKYPQSCILVDTGIKKILFDPGILKYKDEYFDVFNSCDAVFVTHKHSDHCNVELISSLKKEIAVFSTSEVAGAYPELSNLKTISEGDTVQIGNATVTAVKAIHGYQPKMRGNEVYENIGYTLSDGKKTIYITSDTICFPTDIKTDVICIPVTGHGVTMSAYEASLFSKETGAKVVILTHMDNPAFEVDYAYIDKHFANAGVEYTILEIGDQFTIG